MAQSPALMPVAFFGHGSPMNALEKNRYTEVWRSIGAAIPKPKAVLCISAHWYTRGTAVTAMAQPRTIHDFGGFPQRLFEVQYPAPGSPALAGRVRDLLAPTSVRLDQAWGLDHGAWSVLAHLFPKADVPVVQLSIDGTQPPQFHYDLAGRLAPLRDEGVLIVGSGSVVHNLGRLNWDAAAAAFEWATQFNDRVRDQLLKRDHKRLVAYDVDQAAHLSVPTPDHYLPLLYAAGLQQDGESVAFAVDGIELGSIGMLTVTFGLSG
jgi:4,5-DOPA dioxygenase extradiol